MATGKVTIAAHIGMTSWVFLALCAICAVTGVYRYADTQTIFDSRIGWHIVVTSIFLAAASITPILSLAKCGHSTVALVCIFSGCVLLLEVTAFYLAYFSFSGPNSLTTTSPFEKILNLPPVVIAIWAASTGWYVAFQAGNKNQRTANAFSIVLQTRTNTEFIKNQDMVRKYFPIPNAIEKSDEQLLSGAALKVAMDEVQTLRNATPIDAAALLQAKAKLSRVKAIQSIKYLLNFYEFMAAGILSKDLDEEMLYQTISPSVVSIYDRSKILVDYFKSPAGGSQALVFQYLADLVKNWSTRLKKDSEGMQ